MNEQDLVRLGMYVNELEHLQTKYGFYLHQAEVYTPNESEPIALVGSGGGSFSVQLLNDNPENVVK